MKLNKWFTRIVFLILFVAASMVIIVELNKEKLVGLVIEGIENNMNGHLTFDRTSVSFLRSFPKIKLGIYDVRITDLDSIELLTTDEFALKFDVLSLIKQPVIENIRLVGGKVFVEISEDGHLNLDIFQPGQNDSLDISMYIEEVSIVNTNIYYRDYSNKTEAAFENFSFNGQVQIDGDLISTKNDIKTNLSMNMGGLTPEYSADLGLISSVTYHSGTQEIQIGEGHLKVNQLPLDFSGMIRPEADFYNYDFKLEAPEAGVKEFLSLLPGIYRNQYESLITSGSFSLTGEINGTTLNKYPVYAIQMKINEAGLRYPQLSKEDMGIHFILSARNDDHSTPYSVLDLTNVRLKLGENFANGSLHSARKADRQDASVAMDVNFNLSELQKHLYLNDFEQLGGLLKSKISGDFELLDEKNLVRISPTAKIDAEITDFHLKSKTPAHEIHMDKLTVKTNQSDMHIQIEDLQADNSLRGNVSVDLENALATAIYNLPIKGRAEINADFLNLTALSGSDQQKSTFSRTIPAFSLSVNGSIDSFFYEPYTLVQNTFSGTLTDTKSQLTYEIGDFAGSKLNGSAGLDNIAAYAMNNDTLKGMVVMKADRLDIDRLIDLNSKGSSDSVYTLIPANLDLQIQAKVNHVLFNKITSNEVDGTWIIKDGSVFFENKAEIFKGLLAFYGSFKEQKSGDYVIDLDIELKELLFAETAKNSKLFSVFIPVADFLEGSYNCTVHWNSSLNKAYYPVLSTLNSYGVLETRNGRLNGFLPLDSMLSFLNAYAPSSVWDLGDSKNWFLVENGRVILKETVLHKDDIKVNLTGSHSFTQDLDYAVTLLIPAKKIKLESIAKKIAQAVKSPDIFKNVSNEGFFEIQLNLNGNIKKPKFNVRDIRFRKDNLSQSVGEMAQEKIKVVKDSIETVVSGKVDEIKGQISTGIDSTKKTVEKEIQAAKEGLKSDVGALADSIKVGNTDSLASKISDLLEKRKKKIEDMKIKIPIILPKKKGN